MRIKNKEDYKKVLSSRNKKKPTEKLPLGKDEKTKSGKKKERN